MNEHNEHLRSVLIAALNVELKLLIEREGDILSLERAPKAEEFLIRFKSGAIYRQRLVEPANICTDSDFNFKKAYFFKEKFGPDFQDF